eukprot:CAMPEP_0183414694 /NCGR_PEP_ID=MMETSP0370-20130417/22563_1 /TAXON_ID=268820 /ORGANISM="Peridinium aciculiferum, Strain PAER-2" /LENGTH=48 /DNA_ID= /DNA_START= /DNA_END= /DNA_ORIENTATION=
MTGYSWTPPTGSCSNTKGHGQALTMAAWALEFAVRDVAFCWGRTRQAL